MKDFFLAKSIELFTFTKTAFAQGGARGDTKSLDLSELNPFSGASNISDILTLILGFMQTISYPIVAIMIMWGAFLILTAGGKPENLSKGKSVIMWAIIGFAIVLMANGAVDLLRDILFTER